VQRFERRRPLFLPLANLGEPPHEFGVHSSGGENEVGRDRGMVPGRYFAIVSYWF
jgi:hypothetical protein